MTKTKPNWQVYTH